MKTSCSDINYFSNFMEFSDLIPKKEIKKLIHSSQCDEDVSKYFALTVFNSLIFNCLLPAHSQSLRSLVSKSNGFTFQIFSGLKGISRTGFSDALVRIDSQIFQKIFEITLSIARKILKDVKSNKIKILDSTWIGLSLKLCPWSVKVSDKKGKSKIGMTIDLGTWLPEKVCISSEKSDMNDNSLFPKSVDWEKSGYTYIHDSGSFKVATFDKFVETGNYVIARKHGNLKLIPYYDFPLRGKIINEHCQILKDTSVWLGKSVQSGNLFRCVIIENLETGKIIYLITNCFDPPPMEIAMLYYSRWQIEIFFRWLKSHLKMNQIINYSENGFKSCIYAILTFHILMVCYRALKAHNARKGWTDTLRELQVAFENAAMGFMFNLGVIFALKFKPT
jgi:hypothetical protein